MSLRVSCPQLVGREAELAGLRDALDRVVGGTPTAVFVSGEAGVGKTRLVREFVGRLVGDGVRVWSGGCAPLAEGLLPYAPVVDILRAVVADVGLAQLGMLAGPTAMLIALLVPDLAEPTTGVVEGNAVVEQPRLFAALLSLFERLGEEVTVLVVEDLHWADPSTCALLDLLVRGLRRGKLLLVCTYRDDELPRSHPVRSLLAELDRGGANWIRLRRLDRAETAVQVAGILPTAPDQALTDGVFVRSGGNPFLVEELLAAPDAAGLPQGLRDILLTRVRQLPETTWRLLLAVALAGRSTDHALLAEVVGLSPDGVLPGVRAAVEEHVLVVEGDRYLFRHALVAEAVIAEAMPDERIRLHRAFASVFGARMAGIRLAPGVPAAALASAYAEVAYHWSAAGDASHALVTAVDAGLAAEAACAMAEARGHFEQALVWWWKAPQAHELVAIDLVGLYEHAAQTAYLTGNHDDALELIRQGIVHVDTLRDPMRAGVLHERLGRHLMFGVGTQSAAIIAYETAVRLVPDTATQPRARVLAGLAAVLMVADRFREVRPWAERALRTARQAGARSEEAHALSTLGTALTALGETEQGLARVRGALVIAKQAGNPDDLGRAYGLVSSALMMAGRFTEMVTVAEDALESCRQRGTEELYGPELLGVLLEALFWVGRWDEVRQRLSEGQFDQQRPLTAKVALQLVGADFHTGTGDLDEAKRCLDRGRQALASGGHTNAVAHLYIRLAEMHVWRGEPRAAGEWVAKTWEVLADSDHGPLIAWLLAVASRTEADLTLVAGSPHTNPAPVPELADLVAGLPDRLTLGPLAQALHAVAVGEQARSGGGDAIAAWALAASQWARLGCPYPTGYARFRQAEALLATPNRRRPAAKALAQAHGIAVSLGAEPLRAEIQRLARRARLDLPVTPSTSTKPVETTGERIDPERLAQVGLTQREEQVLALLAQGHTNREIAKALFISQKTVNVHVSHILAKLGVPNRAAAATAAHHQGLIVDLTVDPPTRPVRDEN